MPTDQAVRNWALNPDHEFSSKYTRAREIGYHKMADELLDISDDGTNDWVERQNKDGSTYTAIDHEHVTRSRLRIETRKWLLSKALPKIYGDKLELQGTMQHRHESTLERVAALEAEGKLTDDGTRARIAASGQAAKG